MVGRQYRATRLSRRYVLARGRAEFDCMMFNTVTKPKAYTTAEGERGTLTYHARCRRLGPVFVIEVWQHAYKPEGRDRMGPDYMLDIDTPI